MSDLPTTFISETQLRATLDPSTHAIGSEFLTVANSIGTSNAVDFEFTEAPTVVTGNASYGTPDGGTTYNLTITKPAADPAWDDWPQRDTMNGLTVNGVDLGPHLFSFEYTGSGEWNGYDTFLDIDSIDADGIDQGPVMQPFDGQNVTVEWTTIALPSRQPRIANIVPYFGVVNEPITLTIEGLFFVDGSEALVLDPATSVSTPLPTTFVSATELTATWTPPDAAPAWQILIRNPDGEQTQYGYGLPVYATPPAVLTSVTPDTALVNTPVTMTVIGTGFLPTSVVDVGDIVDVTTTYVSATELTATFTSGPSHEDIWVTVNNPPDGGWSESLPFAVTAPAPTLTSITPNTCTVAQVASVPATIIGTGLTNCNVQLVNEAETSWTPATIVTATDTQIDVASITNASHVAGNYTIVVTDVDTSEEANRLPFTVTA